MKLVELKINEFVDILSSDAPAPGGGSAAALQGAIGVALTKMVASLTVGRVKYQDYQEFAKDALAKAEELKTDFLNIIDEDTQAFNEVSAVFTMPKETQEEKIERKLAMQKALKLCTKTPYKMMELSLLGLELTLSAIGKTNKSAASDLGVAALSLKAAAQGAWLNILINISGIEDESFKEEYHKNGTEILQKAVTMADNIYEEILKIV